MADFRPLLAGAACAVLMGLGACSLAPPYAPPTTPAVVAFKEMGPWTIAEPADAAPKGDWWSLFGDPTLTGLEGQVAASNPTFAEALSRYDQAQAFLAQTSAAEAPRIGTGGYITTNRQSDNRPLRGSNQPNQYAANSLTGAIDYELDLWGRIRNLVEAGKDEAQATEADAAAIKLSLQAQLADNYFRLRGLDAQITLLRNTVSDYQRAYNLTDRRHAGGVSSGLDVARAQAQLSTAKAQISEALSQRALTEHAIASLVGQPASVFSLASTGGQLNPPLVPVGLPSTLLQRRPDVAAAERRVAETNAEIGVARAAFYPSIVLDASGGFQNTGGANFFSGGNSLWTIGPQMAFTIFDGGRRRAQVAAATAIRDAAGDVYKGRVLQAFQEVEDALALSNRLADESVDQSDAVAAAGKTEALSVIRYEKGATNFLDVTVAQTAALQARQAALDLNTRRLQASVRLVRALGGGWRETLDSRVASR